MFTPNDEAVKKSDIRQLQRAKEEDSRHRLHTESVSRREYASPWFNIWVDEYLIPTLENVGTRAQVLRDMTWPLPSNILVDRISDAASAVHKAQDRYIGIQMSSDKLQADAEEYIERVDVNGFMSRKVHNASLKEPNSLVIVDTAVEQQGDYPEPYFYLLPSDRIQKIEALDGSNEQGLLRFVWFDIKKGPGNVQRRAMFDDTHISVYEKGTGVNEWSLKTSFRHNLPFNPAFKAWGDTDDSSPLLSNTLIRPSLGALDQYIYWEAAKHANDQKAAFSPFWSFEGRRENCGYKEKTPGGFVECANGVVTMPVYNGSQLLDQPPIVKECPACAKRKAGNKTGLGSNIKIPVPMSKDQFDMRLPAGWIEAPILALEYITKKVTQLAASIQESATGSQQGPQNDQALNESQILAILEAARQIGDYLAEYFELTHKRILDAVLGLRYGPGYLGCTVNYGRRFSVLSGDLLMTLLTSAKETGVIWLIEEINGMVKDYYGRGDVSRTTRFDTIDEISRYPFMSPADMVAGQIHTLDRDGYLLQAGLYYYIRRFEREKGFPIEQLVMSSPDGVNQIIEGIGKYVSEIKPVIEDNGKGQPTKPGNGG